MTKARDLAGFSTGSITNTTADGLILKGDGSSTDVVIKNGANATVATVSDGSTNLSVAGSVTGALARGAIQVGNSSGVAAALAKGTSGYVLTAGANDLSWAASGASAVVFPTDWSSPTNTYTSSGTWSKGSLADDDYVWIYLLGSGGGGGSKDSADSNGGDGGAATLLYGKASVFNGGAYVIGAAKAGNAGGTNNYNGTTPNASTFTLTSANGSLVFSTAGASNTTSDRVFEITSGSTDVIDTAGDDFTLVATTQSGSIFSSSSVLPSGVVNVYYAAGKTYQGTNRSVEHSLFGGGNGGAYKGTGTIISSPGTSEFSGAGGAVASTGTDGSAPGGGGGGSTNSSNAGGTGAAGNVRVYHV
jgi:hypothetical protein